MDVTVPLSLLAGMSPQQFMKRHWQRRPLLVRQAVPGFTPLLDRAALFDLAGRDGVEARLVQWREQRWRLRQGPFRRRGLPALKQPDWTLLVQGVDLHHEGVHQLLQQFRFVPDARLDDLMISYATDGGGVGPHFDSYDVFLLQAQGRRRWRIGRQKDLRLRDDVPLKILADFRWEQEFVLEAGDMLYLPPRYAHDGVALGECMTYSVGFRAPAAAQLAGEILQRLAEQAQDDIDTRTYGDAAQAAVDDPGEVPARLQAFAQAAVQRVLADASAIPRALGEVLSEPKANVWFEASAGQSLVDGVRLDAGTRMLYDDRHVFINGESHRASGHDARLLRGLCNRRRLDAAQAAAASPAALELLQSWQQAGWLHAA